MLCEECIVPGKLSEIAGDTAGLDGPKGPLSYPLLGAYPGDPGPPGADCSGVVSSCCTLTRSSQELLVGDAVLALASGSFATTVDVPLTVASLMSSGTSFELAASTPSVYMTVWLALQQACGASESDTILVHAGSGGIGTAAINVSNALIVQA